MIVTPGNNNGVQVRDEIVSVDDKSINMSIKSEHSISVQSMSHASKKNPLFRRATTNKPEDFLKLNEALDAKKLLWNDNEGIMISHSMWMHNLANLSLQFSLWVKKNVTDVKKLAETSDKDVKSENLHYYKEVVLIGECY